VQPPMASAGQLVGATRKVRLGGWHPPRGGARPSAIEPDDGSRGNHAAISRKLQAV
jgi:hypothetical protein